MPSPFPGMDPFLENPELWPDVHHGLIEAIRDFLAPRVRPKYRVAIEKRAYLAEPEGLVLVGRPDVSVVEASKSASIGAPADEPAAVQPVTVTLPIPDVAEEAYLEVRDLGTGDVVTALELLSPANKRSGEGRRLYEMKRQRVLGSLTHLVEIDLLRGGDPLPVGHGGPPKHYRLLVSRSQDRPHAKLYAFGVREGIPRIPLPLRHEDAEPELDLRHLLGELYDRAGYDLAVDYTQDPVPRLEPDDADWADRLLHEKGLRTG